MFWRIGFTNAWRILERSLLAVISIALAAGFMTNATSFSRGYAQRLYAPYRSVIGGEISAYSMNFNLSSEDVDADWQYCELRNIRDTDLTLMMPELVKGGYIAQKQSRGSFSDEALAALETLPALSGIYPRYQIPAINHASTGMWQTPLRGRDLELDARLAQPLTELITQGRWFTTKMVVVWSPWSVPAKLSPGATSGRCR